MAILTNRHDASKLDTAELSSAADDILFQPSPLHQTLKAQFWARFTPSPIDDSANLTLASVLHHVGDSRLKRYWALPGFREWFTNRDENRERVEYLWMVGLDTAESILRDGQANPAAKVQLLKLLAEVTGRVTRGSQKEEKFSDETVNRMDEKELRGWLKKRGITMSTPPDAPPTKE